MYSLRCSDAGFDCDYTIEKNSEEELIQEVKEHGIKDHNLQEKDFTPDLVDKIRKVIKKE